MKTHCRCNHCRHRRKLPKHPDEYRHRVELEQIRTRSGRYAVCYSDCFHHPHRIGSIGCKFDEKREYRDFCCDNDYSL